MINKDQEGFYEGITISPDEWKAIEAFNKVLGVSLFQFCTAIDFSFYAPSDPPSDLNTAIKALSPIDQEDGRRRAHRFLYNFPIL